MAMFATRIAVIVCGACALVGTSLAQDEDKTLTVATRDVPPFAIKKPDGAWGGFAVDLWREVAAEKKWKFQGSPLREAINQALLDYTGRREWQQTLSRYLGP